MIGGRGISWRATAALCALAGGGCDAIFRVDHVDFQDAHAVTGDTRPIDGPPDDGDKRAIDAASACTTPVLYDPFSGNAACSPWATSVYGPMTSEANGVLTIALPSTGSVVGGCRSDNGYTLGSGITAIVNETVSGSNGYTVLEIHPLDIQIADQGGMLVFQTAAGAGFGNPITYSAAMKWWRMRPSGTSILGEYSLDGSTWQLLGTDSNTVTSGPTGVEIVGGLTSGGHTGQAVFDQLVICP